MTVKDDFLRGFVKVSGGELCVISEGFEISIFGFGFSFFLGLKFCWRFLWLEFSRQYNFQYFNEILLFQRTFFF